MRSTIKLVTPNNEYYYSIESFFFNNNPFLHLPHVIINISDNLILFLRDGDFYVTDLFGHEMLGRFTWRQKTTKSNLWSADCFRSNGRPFIVFRQSLYRGRKIRDNHKFFLHDLSRIYHIYFPASSCYYANHGILLLVNYVTHRDFFAVVDLVHRKYSLFTINFQLYGISEIHAVRYIEPWLYVCCNFKLFNITTPGILICNLETGSVLHYLYPRTFIDAFAGFYHNRYMLFWNYLYGSRDMYCFDVLDPTKYRQITFTTAYGKKLVRAYRQVFQITHAPRMAVIAESSDKGNVGFYHHFQSKWGYTFWMHNGHIYTAARVSAHPECVRNQYLEITLDSNPRTRMSLADMDSNSGEHSQAELILIDSGPLSQFSWKKI